MILLIDNYDSFSYNLYQLIGSIDPDIKVIRNDELTVEEIRELNPERIILSPGPGRPENAGVITEVAKELGKDTPILGVALSTDTPLFSGCSKKTLVARYHSLAADKNTIPDCLTVTAETTVGEIMAVQHKEYPIFGVQFHPESIMTPEGAKMLDNFINYKK